MPPCPRTPVLALTVVLVLTSCARTDPVQPVSIPFAAEAAPLPSLDPLRALEELAAAPANGAIAQDLADLTLAETDGRCRAFLDAGGRAWLAGCRDAARTLWGMALDCRPARPACLPVGDAHALLVHRPLDSGAMPALGEYGQFPARRAFDNFEAIELDPTVRRDRDRELAGLVEVLVPRPANADGCVVVRGAYALELVPRESLAGRAKDIEALARRQQGVVIAIAVRWIRFPLAAKGAAELFEAKDGRELDGVELERLRAEHGGVVLSAPRLTAFPGQIAHIALIRTISYVADYELTAASVGNFVADPVIATAVAGQTVEVCAVVAAGDAVALRVAPALCEVAEPIPDLRLTVPGLANAIVVQMPRAARYSLSRVVTIAKGRTRWIPVGMTVDAEGVRYGIGLAIEAGATLLGKEVRPTPTPKGVPTPPNKEAGAPPPNKEAGPTPPGK